MYDRILVPLDGSKAAEIVLPYVEEIAAKLGGRIILVSACDATVTGMEHLYRSYLEHTVEVVQDELKDWGAKEEIAVQGELLLGKPATVIVKYATEEDVSLIAMASHGSSGRGAWPLGSIATKILYATDQSVLLVRAPARDEALKERKLLKIILLPLDGSKAGEAAIPQAMVLAKALGAKLVLFQVIELFSSGGRASYYVMPGEENKRASLAYLDEVERRLREEGISASSAISIGAPAEQIIDYAAANSIDLIALPSHGESGLTRWVFGSVTNKVLHAGDTPVLVVRRTKQV